MVVLQYLQEHEAGEQQEKREHHCRKGDDQPDLELAVLLLGGRGVGAPQRFEPEPASKRQHRVSPGARGAAE